MRILVTSVVDFHVAQIATTRLRTLELGNLVSHGGGLLSFPFAGSVCVIDFMRILVTSVVDFHVARIAPTRLRTLELGNLVSHGGGLHFSFII
jgi:S-adenosylmethionine:diacylglycerol 3-amino-3-carboxypropyl transferase